MPNAIFRSKKEFIKQYRDHCRTLFGKEMEDATGHERFYVLASLIAQKARATQVSTHKLGEKKVYYFSLEFLIGPLLDNYLLNFGVHDLVEDALADMGMKLEDLCRYECDPGLGNGGLGRLAACFLDSMAKEGICGYGNGMRYRYGLFRQEIENGRQVEKTDAWLEHGYPWETRKAASAVAVQFGGYVQRHEENGRFWFTTEGAEKVLAVPYDVEIVGYGGGRVNKLRLWKAEPYRDDFNLDAFNEGRYSDAFSFRFNAEAISTTLYPADHGEHGKLLRLKQEYLFVSAGLQTILRSYEREYGPDWENLGEHVCVHTNDTHPAMAGPELMRILVDEKGVDFDLAFKIAQETCTYTNHTVMPEALEKWPIYMFRSLLPRLYMFIEEIDRRFRETFPRMGSDWHNLLQDTAILWDGQVRMANLSVIFSNSVNGVSALHTEIIKNTVLSSFYMLTPEKFNNKTNGVSHRRFLGNANPTLASVITDAIGDKWLEDATQFERLLAYKDDDAFLAQWADAKKAAKLRLAAYVKETTGVVIDTNTVFDTQVKRFHAYKRQLLSVFKVMDIYNRMLADSSFRPQPTTFIYAGKAAASYFFAKEVIRLINGVAEVINNDPRVNEVIKVVFVPNFAVSNAQIIYPATEISEQISTAGTEASGTSNMKFMMNGAITLGTYDGANVEICDLVGEENIKIFGMRTEEVMALYASGRYWAWNEYNADRTRLGRVIDELVDGTFARQSGNFESVHDELMVNNDQYLVCRDFHSYVQAWEELTGCYSDVRNWNRVSLHNTAKSGFFSSDRTIREYAAEIWHVGE